MSGQGQRDFRRVGRTAATAKRLLREAHAGTKHMHVGLLPLLEDFGVEVVRSVLGFPVAAAEEVAVLEGAVRVDVLAADLEDLFGDERPAVRPGGDGEEVGEGGFGGAFVYGIVVGIGLERGVVGLDGGVGRLDGGHVNGLPRE